MRPQIKPVGFALLLLLDEFVDVEAPDVLAEDGGGLAAHVLFLDALDADVEVIGRAVESGLLGQAAVLDLSCGCGGLAHPRRQREPKALKSLFSPLLQAVRLFC